MRAMNPDWQGFGHCSKCRTVINMKCDLANCFCYNAKENAETLLPKDGHAR